MALGVLFRLRVCGYFYKKTYFGIYILVFIIPHGVCLLVLSEKRDLFINYKELFANLPDIDNIDKHRQIEKFP